MSDSPSDAAISYNTPDFVVRIPPNLTILADTLPVRVGAPAPEFEARRLDGGTFRLADAAAQRRHVVLMTGAITSPMAAIPLPEMNAIYREFQDQGIDFYLLYVKESHPAENYRHHTSLEQKIAYAQDFRRFEKPAFPVLVDDLEGSTHRSYGPWPSGLFIVHANGLLVFRSTIANPDQLRTYLRQLVGWDRIRNEHPDHVPHIGYTEFLVEHDADEAEHHRVYERAGPKAFEDYWKFHPIHRGVWPAAAPAKH